MEEFDWFLDLLIAIWKKLCGLSRRGWIILIIIILLPIVWIKVPDPWSVEIAPLYEFSTSSIVSQDVIKVSTAELNAEYSFLGEVISAIGSESGTMSIINDVQEMAETTDNLKYKDSEIIVPENAGVAGLDFLSIYNWEKTYCRFFIDKQLFQDNILIILDNQVIYITGGQNGYLSFNIKIQYGYLR